MPSESLIMTLQIDRALQQNGASGIIQVRKVATKDKGQFLMNLKRFSMVLSNNGSVRI